MKQILVVDDDSDCREFAVEVLGTKYNVRTADSQAKCREELAKAKPDLIILDVMMSHLTDGLDMSRELKDNPDTCNIPVIMLTSVNDVYNYREQIDMSYFPHNRWLEKPVKPVVLLEAVGEILK